MTETEHQPGQLVALVRHGETEWNRQRRWQGSQGVELNETGRRHAAAAGRVLAGPEWAGPEWAGGEWTGQQWDWMISSPALRARQTAEIIAADLGQISLEFDGELVEQDFGVAEGMPIADADAQWPARDYPGKEDRDIVAKRGCVALERIRARNPGNGIIVGHGAFIRITLNALTGEDVPRILNGTVSTVRRNAGGWQLVDVNRTEQTR